MRVEIGSFDWYMNQKDLFFHHICKAIMSADYVNKSKMKSIFPHICEANEQRDWRSAPKTDSKIIKNDFNESRNSKVIEHPDNITDPNSFNGLLFLSGSFASNLARSIIYADENNRHAIKNQYKEMVIEMESGNWNMSVSSINQ